jgi:hypothetical protein
MDEQINNIYSIKSSIVYKKSLCEIIEDICNINEDNYKKIVQNCIIEKKEILENNNENINKLFII